MALLVLRQDRSGRAVGVTYGVVFINEKLRDKAPLALAFKAAMHHSCKNADNIFNTNGHYNCDVHSVVFLEDRSWVDEETGEAYPESIFIEANKKAGNR
ncbi:hypothetical protein SLS55_005823 [Diplodia seriata]|uniref:Uncharacterized protein n=1 Tax=Diplodia seriata TaxID=420778 RepID=A0ABR3CHH3_9PEZI